MTEKHISRRLLFWIAVTLAFFVFLFLIRSILLPFVLGIFIAYILDPVADRLEKSGLSRGVATTLLTVGFFLALLLLLLLIVPVLVNQFSGLIAALPGYIHDFEEKYEPDLVEWLGALPAETVTNIKSGIADFSGVMIRVAGEFATNLFQSGFAFVQILSLILITPIVAFYLLHDWDGIKARTDRLLPRPHADTIREQLFIIDRTLAGFLRGQINVCLLLGIFYAIGLSLVGLKFGIVIGFATGLLAIFPYVGLMLGMATGLGVAFFQFGASMEIVAVLAVFVIGQIIEGNFVTPKLVGDKVGLHPLWIIFGMLAGAALFGFVGVLLAVPATAVIGVLIRFAIGRYLQSSYYHGEARRRKG